MKRFAFSLRDRTADTLSIEAIRRDGLRRLPHMVRAYIESVAEDGLTADRNLAAFRAHRLVPRALAGHATPDLSVSIGGERLGIPVLIAPTGLAGLVRPDGEIALARAAAAAGTRLILSTATSTQPERIPNAAGSAHWFQLYPIGDAEFVLGLVARARASGFRALVVTVDAPVVGKREDEARNGLGVPVRLTPGRCLDVARHPRWLAGYIRSGKSFPVLYPTSIGEAAGTRPSLQADLVWSDIAWLRDQWDGPFYVKGLLRPDDALFAIDQIGATGVILSNHGGRQLGDTMSPLDILRESAHLINGRGEILIDGGIRRGSDILKAMSLGANAVLIGRPALYGLAHSGEVGAGRVLEILKDELRNTMILTGCGSIPELKTGNFIVPSMPFA
ncbi:L-lactate dehydrogenase (cytochrome)/(S)-mandelate dehydrogenase [Sphingobium sp. OAS761]|uniref:alpha-hydroxy acid oxidase n=1 Tax=Sphingobium sp. OAS761 TaxID=2817901 RepID=UPI00209EAC62|nr:L-lactate dehydrogenase (cytochrome)/(S)-mandelate dehydrogenase [Sphingobium sp. OAS761]